MGSMGRKVAFTPGRFAKKIWDLRTFDVSRDGRFIAYSANKGTQWTIYVRDLRPGREHALVKSEQAMLNPEFSPDGRFVAMQADFHGDENSDVYVVPVKGGGPKRITDDPMDDADPRWSPDGRTLAFISNRNKDRENVFVVSASGGEAKQLTFEDDIVSEIAWRPDGRGIAFQIGVGDRDWVGLVDLDGHVSRLVEFPESESGISGDYGKSAPWSPDGRTLAFFSSVHDHLDIGAVDVETGRVRWLVENRWDKAMPLWSPDGTRIAYLENHDGNIQLRTVRADGQGSRPISPADGVASRPRWSPEGRGLLYLHSTATTPLRLVLQRGTRRTTVVDSARAKLPKRELAKPRLVWYPSFDGRKIPALLFMPPKER